MAKELIKALVKNSIMDNSVKKDGSIISTNSLSHSSIDEDGDSIWILIELLHWFMFFRFRSDGITSQRAPVG